MHNDAYPCIGSMSIYQNRLINEWHTSLWLKIWTFWQHHCYVVPRKHFFKRSPIFLLGVSEEGAPLPVSMQCGGIITETDAAQRWSENDASRYNSAQSRRVDTVHAGDMDGDEPIQQSVVSTTRQPSRNVQQLWQRHDRNHTGFIPSSGDELSIIHSRATQIPEESFVSPNLGKTMLL